MKIKTIIFSLIIFSFSFSTFAQQHRGCKHHREEIKSDRIAFITDALSLSVKKAQQFWPIYNDYDTKIEQLRSDKYSKMATLRKKNSNLTEAEYQTFLDKYIYFIEEEARLKKVYQKDLSTILSAEKIYLLYKAERDFKRKLVKGLRGKKPTCLE